MQMLNSKWPTPKYHINNEPHFLFIITPPFSGSTALSEFLNSGYRTMILQRKGEGQWLIPGLCENDRWNPEKKVIYESVKAVWLKQYENVNRLVQNIDVVIEKSPPNMMRIKELSSQFKDYSFIANNRNPYASCASRLYRNYDAENIGLDEREKILAKLANDWLTRSRKIKELIQELKIPLITYEEFCKKPSSVISLLQTPSGVAESINPDTKVKVKDYEIQEISNQNERQISKLSGREINSLTTILTKHEELLAFFDYAT